MGIIKFYCKDGLSDGVLSSKLSEVQRKVPNASGLKSELCYNIEIKSPLSDDELGRLKWLLSSPFEPEKFSLEPFFNESTDGDLLVEIGPRLNFSTAFSSNAVSICHSAKLMQIVRLEVSTRYLISWKEPCFSVDSSLVEMIASVLHDRMTECQYTKPLESFDLGVSPEAWYEVDIMTKGRRALEEVNSHLGLAFDDWDLDYYTDLFKNKLKRNPTSVECFDLAQSNSEHSRHWFFKGKLVIDGKEELESLFDMIISTQDTSNPNNVIKFSDNSSAIEGYKVTSFRPSNATEAAKFQIIDEKQHIIFTAETHNFPTGVAPFSGATTGTGGRIRDIHAVGRGGHYIAGTAGYSVGNLLIPGYPMPWEDKSFQYPPNFASPLEILIQASNGASDYGNKFGEPVICGFVRTFGLVDPTGERREWIKPIMFSGGVGSMDAAMTNKLAPEKGMKVVKLGGPVYRIGVGGGSASSIEVQGDNKCELDFGAVQRGDAEMEQKLHRVIRACVEMGKDNPICSIHDQGAGGNGNVLKELVEPEGAVIFTRSFQLGDPTINTLELWGAEYQENDALLCRPEDVPILKKISTREKCPINFVGTVLDNGKVILSEEDKMDDAKYLDGSYKKENVQYPVDLDLEFVLGKMPRKTFILDHRPSIVRPLNVPKETTALEALKRVLCLPSVASKRYLTNKVDRSVTGLIAQQQCVGPLHTPLADVAVTALSHFSVEGVATAIGEQPIKTLLNPAAGARMTVGESLSNLVFAKISDLKDVKCSGNWMWPAKLPGEGAALHEACTAMCKVMKELGVAIDGGKDSLSMAARVGEDTVKAPGTLVVSSYAPCPDIRKVITPDLKNPSVGCFGSILHIDLSRGKSRLGGSALAQCYGQLGDVCPDLDDPELFKRAFMVTQKLIAEGEIISGHDISDGGLITALVEMTFGGLCGISLDITHKQGSCMEALFAEELGWILEVDISKQEKVQKEFMSHDVPCYILGKSIATGMKANIHISFNGQYLFDSEIGSLFSTWEETSYRLEMRQANPECVKMEFESLILRKCPPYRFDFNPDYIPEFRITPSHAPRVAVVREEGSNGDREMGVAFYKAGFQVWDVTMQDFLSEKVTTQMFRGLIFPGGFSYADVLGSAKGWASTFLFNPLLRKQFQAFAEREDTFSFGVCNGCQLMSYLGWLNMEKPQGCLDKGKPDATDNQLPTPDILLAHNVSERFECRFSTVCIENSQSIMMKGMEGSVLGVWVAHGEGRFTFRNNEVLSHLTGSGCFPLKYINDHGKPTMEYPLNPNGSTDGVAAVCSQNGRHLAMMPHPERTIELWQWPWIPHDMQDKFSVSPWRKLFANAYDWCTKQE